MNNKSVIWVVVALIFGIGAGLFIAKGQSQDFKVGVVNVPQVVAASSRVTALKAEEAVKIQELQEFVQMAQKEAGEAKGDKAKQDVVNKYEKEIMVRKSAIERDYAVKLAAIDKEITAIIVAEAAKQGINVVFAKNNIISGGTNITDSIVKAVK